MRFAADDDFLVFIFGKIPQNIKELKVKVVSAIFVVAAFKDVIREAVCPVDFQSDI